VVRLALSIVGLVALARPARASEYRLSDVVSAVDEALAEKPTPISTPLVELGGGVGLDGAIASAAIGWGWGERDHGLFPGSAVTRVLLDGTYHPGASLATLTIGWYQTSFLDLGFDGGVEARGTTLGPTGRVTIGLHGIGARFGAGALFGGARTDVTASAELVIEVMELADRL
jgi:hypothetical protein